jgi:alpha-glucosidase/alpha-D-xyloside xylohydrolase
MIRALWLHYPDDPRAVARGDEYLFGRDLLVAPVVEKGATSRSLYLPHGTWFDFWTHERQEGGRELVQKVDLGNLPLYVRAGAVLPIGPPRQSTTEPADGPLTMTVFPGADSVSFLYQDDGESFGFRNGEFVRIEMQWEDTARRLAIRLASGARMLRANPITLSIKVVDSNQARTVTFKGDPLSVTL